MRTWTVAGLLLVSASATAQLMPGGMREGIVAGGLSTGKTYQVAKRCGSTQQALDAYKARVLADTRGGEALYAQLGIDFEKVFEQGRAEGEDFYETIRSTPNRSQVCASTLELVNSYSADP